MFRKHMVFHLLVVALFVPLVACGNAAIATTPATVTAPTLAAQPTSTGAAPTSTTAATAMPATATTAPTSVPATVVPTLVPSAGSLIAVQLQDHSIQLVSAGGSSTLLYKANDPVDISSIFPPGNVVGSALYLPLSAVQSSVVRVGSNGAQTLSFIQGPVYGIAASSSMLAWGTADINSQQATARIQLSAPDGSNLKTGLQETSPSPLRVLRAMRWSSDGARLYFGKEPIGLGGYILFSGLTNLWALDPNTGKATELEHEAAPNAFVCIDDLAPNEKLTADHCSLNNMQVVDLSTKTAKVINPPANVPTFGVVGGARFSPDSSRLAYGLARRNPDNEQGWVAVADVSSGTSTLIATSPAQDYFSVVSWLDSGTLVLQSGGQTAGIWTVGVDGSNLKRLGDGIFLGLVQGGPG